MVESEKAVHRLECSIPLHQAHMFVGKPSEACVVSVHCCCCLCVHFLAVCRLEIQLVPRSQQRTLELMFPFETCSKVQSQSEISLKMYQDI